MLHHVWHPSFAEHDRFQVETASAASRILLFCLFAGWQEQCHRVFEELGLQGIAAEDLWTTPSFVVHRTLFQKFGSQAALEEFETEQVRLGTWEGMPFLLYRFLLALNGVVLKPEYRPFFVGPHACESGKAREEPALRS